MLCEVERLNAAAPCQRRLGNSIASENVTARRDGRLLVYSSRLALRRAHAGRVTLNPWRIRPRGETISEAAGPRMAFSPREN